MFKSEEIVVSRSGLAVAFFTFALSVGNADVTKADTFNLDNLFGFPGSLIDPPTPAGDLASLINGFVDNVTATGFNLHGSDSGLGFSSTTTYTAVALAAETLTFSWTYTTFDLNGSAEDPGGYVLNGVYTQLSDDNFSYTGGLFNTQGTVTFTVNAGDVYGFYVSSFDNFNGAGEIDVTSAAAAVPGPIAGAGIPGLLL